MATATNSGSDFEIRNITVNSSSDTPVDFNSRVNSVLIRCRSSIDLYIRYDRNSADYFTIPAGTSLSLDVSMRKEDDAFYVRSASDAPIIEVIGSVL
jgi:hypothetical protein